MSFRFVKPTQKVEKVMVEKQIFQKSMLNYYKKIVKNEVYLGKIVKTDRVLCIGGGYFPCTAILINMLTKAEVTVIDNDKKTIETARKIVEKLKLCNVHVKQENGLDVEISGYDVVHIAMQVSPKQMIFDNLMNKKSEKTRVLVRVPKKRIQKGYEMFETEKFAYQSVKQPIYSNIERTLQYDV